MAGKRIGNGVSFSVWCVLMGVGGLGSGSLHPVSQYDVTMPFPFSSTSPRKSIRNVPNLFNICFVASDTWIFKAAWALTERIRMDFILQVGVKGMTYVSRPIPFGRLCSRCLQTSNSAASFARRHQHKRDLQRDIDRIDRLERNAIRFRDWLTRMNANADLQLIFWFVLDREWFNRIQNG